jgi:hypothetical protein
MDPDAAMRNLCDCLDEGDYENASNNAESLLEWMFRKGFDPKPDGRQWETLLRFIKRECDKAGAI